MLYFKAQNRLLEKLLYSIDIIINRYRKNRLYQRLEPLQGNKKTSYTSILLYMMFHSFTYQLTETI